MKTTQHGKKSNAIRSLALCLVLLTILVQAATASEVALPRQSNAYLQTNGGQAPEKDGDWWTHETHGSQPHLFQIVVPAGVNDFNLAVEIFDPESYCTDIYTDPDEQKSNLVWEDTRVRLLDNDKSTVLYETVYPGGSSASNQRWVSFYSWNVSGPHTYYLDVSLLPGTDAIADDENGYKIRIVNGNTDGNEGNGNEIGLYALRTAFSLLGAGDLSYTFGFYVPPGQATLNLYNYDMEQQGPVTYISPDGVEYSGAVSGSSAWNTTPPINTLPSANGDVIDQPQSGWWAAKFSIRQEDGKNHNTNQFIFWPNDLPFDGVRNLGSSIGDRVWRDANLNGLQDADETGVGGVGVKLLNAADNSVLRTTTSAPDGSYLFMNVPAGRYILEFTASSAWYASPNGLGSDRNLDSNPEPNSGRTGIITVGENRTILDIDAGFIPKNISNLVVHKSIDANGNRFYPGDEFTFVITVANQGPQAANHVRVMDQLPEAVTFISAERIADSGPDPLVWYEAELASGASVSYRVTVRANTQLGTFENCAFVSSPNLDENLNNNSSCSQFFILERPAGNSNIRIGDRVWQDTNKNGVQDEGENGLAKVKVQLLSSPGGNLIAETTTDENGLYAFAQVAPGSYLLAFEHLKDYYFTLVDQGEDDKDSDADPVTGRTGSLTVAADQVDDRWDAGMVRREAPSQLDNRIGDRVWLDSNGNGVQEAGESGIEGIQVQLLSSPSATLVATTATNSEGLFSFVNVAPGNYLLAFSLLDGHHFTLVGQGDEATDSDAEIPSGRTAAFSIAADEKITGWDAGMTPNDVPSQLDNSIGDRVWLDSNGNGLQEEGESGIEGIQVQLLSSPSATLVATTATNSEGLFSFVNVAPGNYLLAFSLLDGHHFTLTGQGDETTDSDAEITSGRTAAFSIAADENITGWDAGMTANDSPERTGIRIGDRIWLDTNKNGLQDEGEPGVPSATVNLLSDPSGTLVLTSLTDAEGQYVFENVPAGSYRLELLLPDNLVFTTADAGGDDIDSDADPATGRTAAFAVENGQQVFLFDIGLKQRTTSNLQVVKSIPDEHTYYYRNQQVTFLIRVTNQGPETAQNVRIIDTVPDGLTFISAAPSQTSGPNPLIWTVESMAVDETIEISVVMQSTEKLGGMDNCVMVSSSSLDPDLANNISCAQIHVLLPVELSSFSARSINNQVVLEWSTQSETENLGFHLLRSDTENGPYTQITQSMIQGAGTSSSLRNYQYQDLTASESKTYYYKLVDVDYNGRLSLHGPIDVTVALPTATVLEQNYPNPFNPTTKIRFILKEQGFAALTIYNVRGEKVRELVADQLNAGAHIVEWDGMDQYGRQAPSGMYLYTLRMNGFEQKRMMMFLK